MAPVWGSELDEGIGNLAGGHGRTTRQGLLPKRTPCQRSGTGGLPQDCEDGQPHPAPLVVPTTLEKCPQTRQQGLKGRHEIPQNLAAQV